MPEIMQQQYASLMKDSNSLDCLKYSSPQMERRYIMAIIITNGSYFIRYTDTGATKKTSDINLAYQFSSVYEAICGMRKAKGKTEGFYVYDTLTQHILWRWMTEEEKEEAKRNKVALSMVKRDKNGKIKRKSYSDDVRKLIYIKAGGRCELCGRKILLDDMTLDHVNPLSMGGDDDVENLSCTCYPCNLFKGNILPSDFYERITDIFMYQMERQNSHNLKWKIVHKLLSSFTQSK